MDQMAERRMRRAQRTKKHDDIKEAGLLLQYGKHEDAWFVYGDLDDGHAHRLIAVLRVDEQIRMQMDYSTAKERRVHHVYTRMIVRTKGHPQGAVVIGQAPYHDVGGLRTVLRKFARKLRDNANHYEMLAEMALIDMLRSADVDEYEVMDARWGEYALSNLVRLARKNGYELEIDDAIKQIDEEARHEQE